MRTLTTVCALLTLCTSATAQYRGIEWSIDGTHPVIDGIPRAVVRVYAGYDDPNWQLNAVYGSAPDLLSISTSDPLGFYQHPFGGNTSLEINPALFVDFPELQHDSWVTIGREDMTDNEMLHIGIDYAPWNSGGSLEADDGAWFAVPINFTHMFPDANGQVLIAQLTVTLGETIQGTVHLQGKDDTLAVTEHMDQTFFIDTGETPGSPYCFGDGSGPNCPCFAFGGLGQGCANTTGLGATMTATGTANLINDTLQFHVEGVPGAKPGLLLRADNQVGVPIGDGILCTSGNSLRSQVQVTVAGATVFTDFQGGPFAAVANSGAPTNFQFWYRDPSNTCSGSGFNFTNAWTVTY